MLRGNPGLGIWKPVELEYEARMPIWKMQEELIDYIRIVFQFIFLYFLYVFFEFSNITALSKTGQAYSCYAQMLGFSFFC